MTDVKQLLESLSIPYVEEGHEHCRSGWIQIDCPRCSPDSQHWRLGLNKRFHYASCWACGRLSIVESLANQAHKPYKYIRELLETLDVEIKKDIEVRGTLKLPKGLGPLEKAHTAYLKARGMDPHKLVRIWGLQGIGLSAKLAWRIFIPIKYKGETVSWTTRSISDNASVRYLSASPLEEKLNHKKLLFGEDYVSQAIVVCEGPFDAMAIGKGATALMGTGFSKEQVVKIARYPRKFICFDNEAPAQQRARELCRTLETFPGSTHNIVLDSHDPGSASKHEIRQIRKHAFGE